ncbi:hypothetical protein GALMADRAFT_148527 [Galerina marginata CBS 339.88]|uniref:Cytochrome P450 n=1 Tax=Galerina marginata (strain CBS 339.88) TaxID=685588 RepID=A0A067SD36_GALM3|nr:hypothetical protein GALMADRAFT_148527 [Galerina marginata CBS 339.88]
MNGMGILYMLPLNEIGDAYAMVDARILEKNQPYPGDDQTNGISVLISKKLLECAYLGLAHSYPARQGKDLNEYWKDYKPRGGMGEALSNVASRVLKDGSMSIEGIPDHLTITDILINLLEDPTLNLVEWYRDYHSARRAKYSSDWESDENKLSQYSFEYSELSYVNEDTGSGNPLTRDAVAEIDADLGRRLKVHDSSSLPNLQPVSYCAYDDDDESGVPTLHAYFISTYVPPFFLLPHVASLSSPLNPLANVSSTLIPYNSNSSLLLAHTLVTHIIPTLLINLDVNLGQRGHTLPLAIPPAHTPAPAPILARAAAPGDLQLSSCAGAAAGAPCAQPLRVGLRVHPASPVRARVRTGPKSPCSLLNTRDPLVPLTRRSSTYSTSPTSAAVDALAPAPPPPSPSPAGAPALPPLVLLLTFQLSSRLCLPLAGAGPPGAPCASVVHFKFDFKLQLQVNFSLDPKLAADPAATSCLPAASVSSFSFHFSNRVSGLAHCWPGVGAAAATSPGAPCSQPTRTPASLPPSRLRPAFGLVLLLLLLLALEQPGQARTKTASTVSRLLDFNLTLQRQFNLKAAPFPFSQTPLAPTGLSVRRLQRIDAVGFPPLLYFPSSNRVSWRSSCSALERAGAAAAAFVVLYFHFLASSRRPKALVAKSICTVRRTLRINLTYLFHPKFKFKLQLEPEFIPPPALADAALTWPAAYSLHRPEEPDTPRVPLFQFRFQANFKFNLMPKPKPQLQLKPKLALFSFSQAPACLRLPATCMRHLRFSFPFLPPTASSPLLAKAHAIKLLYFLSRRLPLRNPYVQETFYPDPVAYKPERFRWLPQGLGPGTIRHKTTIVSFSYGAFGCLGRALAIQGLQIVAARMTLDDFPPSFNVVATPK